MWQLRIRTLDPPYTSSADTHKGVKLIHKFLLNLRTTASLEVSNSSGKLLILATYPWHAMTCELRHTFWLLFYLYFYQVRLDSWAGAIQMHNHCSYNTVASTDDIMHIECDKLIKCQYSMSTNINMMWDNIYFIEGQSWKWGCIIYIFGRAMTTQHEHWAGIHLYCLVVTVKSFRCCDFRPSMINGWVQYLQQSEWRQW